jgi:aspartyl-tRNA synthetase
MIFVDLRDRYGITQIMFDPQRFAKDEYAKAKSLGNEFVIGVEGEVVARATPNDKLETGDVEVRAEVLHLLSASEVLPFSIADDSIESHEDLRLKYRYLDMRKGQIISNLVLRHQAMLVTRTCLADAGFIEVSTPVLCKATPEGARDYLVPSRIHNGSFYALPQSPQIFKQLLMVGGLDRYFQIAPCFRDEDLRADRQPEFHQIDMEMSFGSVDQLFSVVEGLVEKLFSACLGKKISSPFRRMTYKECVEHYGTDRPDLRFGMALVNVSDLGQNTSFQAMRHALAHKGIAKGITVKGGASFSRKKLDEYQQLVGQFGFQGMLWLKRGEELQGPLAKYIPSHDVSAWIERLDLQVDDVALMLFGQPKKVHQALDQLRRKVAKDMNIIDTSRFEPLWVVDFPLFAWNEEENKIESEHNPFTSPHIDDMALLDTDPLAVRSSSYDLVMNGYELASGARRNHDGRMQKKIFDILGLSPEVCRQQFGFFIEALSYGTPPHLGIAMGFDRLIMIMKGTENIRDVVAFPKNQKAYDLMSTSPSQVLEEQLNELGITLRN